MSRTTLDRAQGRRFEWLANMRVKILDLPGGKVQYSIRRLDAVNTYSREALTGKFRSTKNGTSGPRVRYDTISQDRSDGELALLLCALKPSSPYASHSGELSETTSSHKKAKPLPLKGEHDVAATESSDDRFMFEKPSRIESGESFVHRPGRFESLVSSYRSRLNYAADTSLKNDEYLPATRAGAASIVPATTNPRDSSPRDVTHRAPYNDRSYLDWSPTPEMPYDSAAQRRHQYRPIVPFSPPYSYSNSPLRESDSPWPRRNGLYQPPEVRHTETSFGDQYYNPITLSQSISSQKTPGDMPIPKSNFSELIVHRELSDAAEERESGYAAMQQRLQKGEQEDAHWKPQEQSPSPPPRRRKPAVVKERKPRVVPVSFWT